MRRIFGLVLAVPLAGACGDNLGSDGDLGGFGEDPGADGVADEADPPTPEARVRPALCGTREWESMQFDTREIEMSIAATPTGAAVFATPKAGGAIRGLLLDGRGLVTGEESGTTIRDDHKFTSVAAAYVDERLVTASFGTDQVHFDIVKSDLTERVDIGSITADMVAPFASSRGGDRIATVAGKDGVSTVTFDSDWKMGAIEKISNTEPFALTATQYFDDAIVAWSTADTCHVRRVAAGVESTRDFPCMNARIAMNPATRSGILVYEEDGNVMLSDLRVDGESVLANRRLLASNASTPRVVFDGERFWISFLDLRADMVVGFTEGSKFVSMSLEGLTAENGNHEIGLVHNRPWVFDLGATGLAARGLCVVADQ